MILVYASLCLDVDAKYISRPYRYTPHNAACRIRVGPTLYKKHYTGRVILVFSVHFLTVSPRKVRRLLNVIPVLLRWVLWLV